jgi:hypothetical protein
MDSSETEGALTEKEEVTHENKINIWVSVPCLQVKVLIIVLLDIMKFSYHISILVTFQANESCRPHKEKTTHDKRNRTYICLI